MDTRTLARLSWRPWIESVVYRFGFAATAVVLPSFTLARPADERLPRELLDRLASLRQPIGKPRTDDRVSRAGKWARRVGHIGRSIEASRILDVACGNGYTALALHQMGFAVSITDMSDERDQLVKQAGLEFRRSDACVQLDYADSSFDLVYSLNAFEHFASPQSAFWEMIRVCRVGGCIYLAFDPLYHSPWGLHAQRRLSVPYPHLLFGVDQVNDYYDAHREQLALTFDELSDRTKIGPFVNGLTIADYRAIFHANSGSVRTLYVLVRPDLTGLATIAKYPAYLKAHTPSFTDLVTGGVKALFVRER